MSQFYKTQRRDTDVLLPTLVNFPLSLSTSLAASQDYSLYLRKDKASVLVLIESFSVSFPRWLKCWKHESATSFKRVVFKGDFLKVLETWWERNEIQWSGFKMRVCHCQCVILGILRKLSIFLFKKWIKVYHPTGNFEDEIG